ncbi:hypothetical protein NLI96_g2512 [Meripilus lineatus]|uniref:Cerato-platanin n=1 Tax=Meripilus lineatus TaxID=2056292 RepID=A0AAD5VAT3_9APHY|nr:hypothetical protein NLI96_g2512 [Physisporinus lineatus]
MQFTTILLSALFAIPAVLAGPTHGNSYATYSVDYDNGDRPLSNVACSNGPNGLLTKGFTTLGSLPSYPYVAGVANVGWNSPYCGSCWGVSYKGKTIYVTAIDSSGVGFALSSKAIQQLTGPDGMRAGKVPVTYWAASPSDCSKPPSSWYVPPLVYDNLVADDLPSSKR